MPPGAEEHRPACRPEYQGVRDAEAPVPGPGGASVTGGVPATEAASSIPAASAAREA